MVDILTDTPRTEPSEAWKTYTGLIAKHFAAQFGVDASTITISPYSDDTTLVCCAGRIWEDVDYHASPSDDKIYFDVDDIDRKANFQLFWSDEEKAILEALVWHDS